ncbi:hypothetical protein [Deinococcus altitudinis]|uniref:hypothetical protein n=1 Tax=Deinococcus altitudinis TaxID=468914 RepID=UPI003891B252
MTLPITSPISSIFSVLASQRTVVKYPGHEFPVILDRLAFLEQNVLMELAVTNHPPLFLVLQKGFVVHAQRASRDGEAAVEHLSTMLDSCTLHLVSLGEATAALVCACIDGVPDDTTLYDNSSLSARLAQLAQLRFSGVVASQGQGRLQIYVFRDGQLRAQQDLSSSAMSTSFMQRRWTERQLPRLTLPTLTRTPALLHESPHFPQGARVPSTTTSPVRPRTEPDSAVIWKVFERLLQAHLGGAAGRIVDLMRSQHGTQQGAELRTALAAQVNRVAGSSAELQFLQQVS